ncbi:hypothetical protein NKH95_24660, partial [Mesorhizobium sp. M0848]|uniref:sensor histidine kinase n=1 Tax=Mesorhizobium sp. M0848 TaxID=2957012 RepID=UPI003339B268
MPGGIAFAAGGAVPFKTIEAVRSGWDAAAPPATGWTSVTLPDDWTTRWPGFDGVVWYRLTFDRPDAAEPLGLALNYWTLAGSISVNGAELGRDEFLVEPLTRSWNVPRYWQLAAPVLHAGTNTLLIRVSGLAPYQPGLGPVLIGPPSATRAHFVQQFWIRRELPVFYLGVTAALGTFFFVVWLLRRSLKAYGWFALMTIAWFCYSLNFVVTSPWPFGATDTWQRFIMLSFMVMAAAFVLFVIRFAERRFPRGEAVLWTALAIGAAALFATPHSQLGPMLNLLALSWSLLYIGACFLSIGLTWRSARLDHIVLHIVNAFTIVAILHDLMTYLGILLGNVYYVTLTSQFQMVGMALVLAWNFVANMRRIEGFNDELTAKIETARKELALTLHQQHEVILANTRLAERVSLSHNLHDGMGGTLVNSIAMLEQAPQNLPADRFLSVLKELRDELRVIIDTAADDQTGGQSLAEWIAPLRRRHTLACESRDIDCVWNLTGLEDCHLSLARSLDLVRILQEGLTNVLKHSQASCVVIDLHRRGETLSLMIHDDGVGFDAASEAPVPGTGRGGVGGGAGRGGGPRETGWRRGGTLVGRVFAAGGISG